MYIAEQGWRRQPSLDLGPNTVTEEGDLLVEQLLELRGHGSEGELDVPVAVRSAEVRTEDDTLGPVVQTVLMLGTAAMILAGFVMAPVFLSWGTLKSHLRC